MNFKHNFFIVRLLLCFVCFEHQGEKDWAKRKCIFVFTHLIFSFCCPSCYHTTRYEVSLPCVPLVVCQLYQRLLPVAGRAEYSRVDLEGRIGLMKLSEACSTKADGRACQAANSEAASVISRA